MKTCSYCGRENKDSEQCCYECGTLLCPVEPLRSDILTPVPQTCIHCGAENPAGRQACLLCANDLVTAEHPADDVFVSDAETAELMDLELESVVEHGFSHPDWRRIREQVQANHSRFQWNAAYRKVARKWVKQLRQELGGNYRAYESQQFILLCAEGRQASQTLLQYAENAQTAIEAQLGRLVVRESYGKGVLLAFSDDDDYYTYISRFYPEGTHNLTAGICINAGYSHVAWPFRFVFSARPVLIHELVHNNLVHLQLPRWLDEGFAQRIEGKVAQQGFTMNHELAQRHRNFWTRDSIQAFWAGLAFNDPDSAELSYHLAQVLVELLADNYDVFLDFAREADWLDAGQDAAGRFLDKDLGAVVGGFLGDGDWRPNRKRIGELLMSHLPDAKRVSAWNTV